MKSSDKNIRILFLHANREDSPEYNVHRILAEHANPDQIDSYFISQEKLQDHSMHCPANLQQISRDSYYDFGRDLSIHPKPSRFRRGFMMLHRFPGAITFLKNKVREVKPHAIYTSQQRYDIQLARMLCSSFHTSHIIHIHYPIESSLGRNSLRAILETPRLLAVSEFVRQRAIEAGVHPEHIHRVSNASDLRQFDHQEDPLVIRSEFGLTAETPLIIAAGRLDPSKGHLRLLDAFAKVHRMVPEVRLLICGKSTTRYNYELVLRRRVAERQLEENVIFAGKRNDMPTIFAAADIFCLPAEDEAFGLVFLEAMLAAVPVVACYSGGVSEIVKDRETGLLSQLGDTDELAANLLKLLRDRKLAQRLGVAGRERALSVFAPQKIAGEWSKIVTELLKPQYHRSIGGNI